MNRHIRPVFYIALFAINFGLFSCNTKWDRNAEQAIDDSQQVDTLAIMHSDLGDINLNDSIGHLLTIALSKDNLEYEAFYNDNSPYELLYFRTGKLFNSKLKHTVALHTINDTMVMCEVFYLINDEWTKTEKSLEMHISRFSPSYFNVWFDDYNFDGYKDIKINFYQSMRVAYSYGYILTFNHHDNSLTLHPETIEIPNFEIDKKSKSLISTEYSNPNTGVENYKIVSKFGWKNGTLQLISKKKMNKENDE